MQVYIEETVAPEGRLQRRSANSDKWINSGGIKGSTTIWLTDVGVRKRYGKYTSAQSGWSAKFEAYTLLTGSRAQPVENNTTVAFVSNANPVVVAEQYHFSCIILCFLQWTGPCWEHTVNFQRRTRGLATIWQFSFSTASKVDATRRTQQLGFLTHTTRCEAPPTHEGKSSWTRDACRGASPIAWGRNCKLSHGARPQFSNVLVYNVRGRGETYLSLLSGLPRAALAEACGRARCVVRWLRVVAYGLVPSLAETLPLAVPVDVGDGVGPTRAAL